MRRKKPLKQPCESGIFWIVEEGDTLYLISRKLRVPLEKILQANPGIDPQNLQIGSKICIPL
ncbi:MAG: LysM peptidoglycan-binding domain-containing protein [Eubacteriales bacterium]